MNFVHFVAAQKQAQSVFSASTGQGTYYNCNGINAYSLAVWRVQLQDADERTRPPHAQGMQYKTSNMSEVDPDMGKAQTHSDWCRQAMHRHHLAFSCSQAFSLGSYSATD